MMDDEVDDDAVAAEWAAMAEEGEDGEGDDDAMAAEWAAVAEEGEGGEGDEDGQTPGRVLDQDEIDSLLGFEGSDDEGESTGIHALINSALVSYERLPMLDIVFDRMVRMTSTSLRNFTSDNIEVSIDNISSVRFGDYLNSIPLPAMLAVFRAEEWDNYGLMTIDSNLIYSIVDVLLGGRRGTAPMRIEGRPYTTIEQNLVERMISVILKDLCASFEPLSPVRFTFDRLETNPRFATIARPPNAAILIKFRVDMEDRGGRLEILFPYATLEPIRELLLQRFMGEKFGRDSIWEGHLASELWSTKVPVTAILDEQTMSLRDVLNFEVGQTIRLQATPTSKIKMRCGHVPTMTGSMGKAGQNIAVKVQENHMKDHANGG
jgi:flagellar motor switch protein FliM